MFRQRPLFTLPSGQGRCDVIMPVQVDRKAEAVHHAAAASLAQIGRHGVGRIADDGDAALRPALQADYREWIPAAAIAYTRK